MPSSRLPPRSVIGRIKTSYPRLQHLLVPLDFSGKSRQALRYALPLAQKFSARVHLAHVLPPVSGETPSDLARRRQTALKRLGAMSTLLPPRLRGGGAVLHGAPAAQILQLADKNNIDLIVLTTRGLGGIRWAILGSTAEQIMRRARCPVMSVRQR